MINDSTKSAAPKRVAMWSGARSLSTALMRSWESRPDTAVWDEPLFAAYLKLSGDNFQGREEVLTGSETDWEKVVHKMTVEPVPDEKAIYYQKHISHLLLDEMGMDWLLQLTNFILIRQPNDMLTSLYKKEQNITVERTGIPHLGRIYKYIEKETGTPPPVIDAADLQNSPRHTLTLLCEALGVEFDEAMLSWPVGERNTDGVWAKKWYGAVEQSTGFSAYVPKTDTVPEHLLGVLDECNDIYKALYECRLR